MGIREGGVKILGGGGSRGEKIKHKDVSCELARGNISLVDSVAYVCIYRMGWWKGAGGGL